MISKPQKPEAVSIMFHNGDVQEGTGYICSYGYGENSETKQNVAQEWDKRWAGIRTAI